MERISIEEAATMLGVSKQAVRLMMQRKAVDIGLVVNSGSRKTYIIFREKLNRLVGKETTWKN